MSKTLSPKVERKYTDNISLENYLEKIQETYRFETLSEADQQAFILEEKNRIEQEYKARRNRLIPPIFKKPDVKFPLDEKKSWYLWGNVGAGKTHIAYQLVKNGILKVLMNPSYGQVPKLVNWCELTTEYDIAPFDQKMEMMIQVKQSWRLIIDDLGAELEPENPKTQKLLYSILNYRLENGYATGFTSNKSVGKLPYRDNRIVSRILGMVGDNRMKLENEDRRLQ